MKDWQKIAWLLVFFLSAFFKIYQFDLFPAAFHPDEKIYLANAYALAKTGTDLSGNWQPWKIEPFHHMFAELPGVIYGLGFLLTDNPFVAGRIFPLLFGTTLPILIYLLVKKLLKSTDMAFWVFVVACFNPWLWQLSRWSFDSLFSVWFYLAGLLLLLSSKKSFQLLSIPILALGFFQYQGLKLIYPLIIIPPLIQKFTSHKKNRKNTLYFSFLSVALLLVFISYLIFKLPNQKASERVSQNTIWGDEYQSEISQAVDTQRRMSLETPLKKIGANKVLSFYFDQTSKLADALDLHRIFVANEPAISGFSVWSHGLFYFIDFLLIFAGSYYLFNRKRSVFWIFLFWFFIGLIPIQINNSNDWYIFRMSWSYLIMLMVIGVGFWSITKQKTLVKILLMVIYLFSIGNFCYQFYFRYPVYSANGVRLYQRVLADYLRRTASDKKILVLMQDVVGMRDALIVYLQPGATELAALKIVDEAHPEVNFRNFDIKDNCFNKKTDLAQYDTVIIDPIISECKTAQDQPELLPLVKELNNKGINSILDSGNQVKIINDNLCNNLPLSTYPNITKVDQFKIEKMSDEEFCLNWIISI